MSDNEAIFQLVYVSSIADHVGDSEVKEIVDKAQNFNSTNKISGVLLERSGLFLQLLEGKEKVVRHLFSKIEKDPRHSNIIVVVENKSPERLYGDWKMGFRKVDDLDVKLVNEILSWNRLVRDAENIDNELILKMLERFKERVA